MTAHPGLDDAGVVRTTSDAPIYRIAVEGRIGDRLADAFTPLCVHTVPGHTVLEGPVEDQAALHGLLDRIQSLGLELVEVRRVPKPRGAGDDTFAQGG
jgi:hypothetical protein